MCKRLSNILRIYYNSNYFVDLIMLITLSKGQRDLYRFETYLTFWVYFYCSIDICFSRLSDRWYHTPWKFIFSLERLITTSILTCYPAQNDNFSIKNLYEGDKLCDLGWKDMIPMICEKCKGLSFVSVLLIIHKT